MLLAILNPTPQYVRGECTIRIVSPLRLLDDPGKIDLRHFIWLLVADTSLLNACSILPYRQDQLRNSLT